MLAGNLDGGRSRTHIVVVPLVPELPEAA